MPPFPMATSQFNLSCCLVNLSNIEDQDGFFLLENLHVNVDTFGSRYLSNFQIALLMLS